MSQGARAAIGIGAIVVAVALFLVLKGGDDDSTTSTTSAVTTTTGATSTPDATTANGGGGDGGGEKPAAEVPVIEIEGGQPVGGVQELSFEKGDDIRFVVESDVDEEVHFHGYDVAEEVAAGGKVAFDVPATLEGVFEVELEHSVVPIAEITVNP